MTTSRDPDRGVDSRGEVDRRHVHLVLLGLMGAGKSTVGLLVANAVQQPFVDSDAMVELRAGCDVVELERRNGLAELHAAELDALRRVLARRDPVVFAAAASVVDQITDEDLERAFVVWLDVASNVLADRIAASDERPALGEIPLRSLRRQGRERRPRARDLIDLWVDVGELGPREIADEVATAWRSSAWQRTARDVRRRATT